MAPPIPEWFISAFAVATVFVVMFHLGLGLLPREFVRATLLTYMIVAAFTVLPYALGRSRLAHGMGETRSE